MIHQIRGYVIPALGVATALSLLLGIPWPGFWWPLVVLAPLLGLGLWDLVQTRHNVLRNYPVIGHLRFILEDWGPELRQYLVESNTSGRPFHRDQRSLIYQRAKNVTDKKPCGLCRRPALRAKCPERPQGRDGRLGPGRDRAFGGLCGLCARLLRPGKGH